MGSSDIGQVRIAEARRRRAIFILMVIAALFVVVPFLFWRGTWFGRPLSEEELGKYLSDERQPRRIQHALIQIGERIARGDFSVERWYPEVARLAESPIPEIRNTLAWVMGADPRSELFHHTLRKLLGDREMMVRRNAALSLVRFGDASGRGEILAMLRPFAVQAPSGGSISFRLPVGTPVEQGTLLARLEAGRDEPVEIRSPLPGNLRSRLVAEGTRVEPGEEVLVLAPGAEHVWEALRALYLVGEPEDLPLMERFAEGRDPDMPPKVQQQAAATAEAIRRRAEP